MTWKIGNSRKCTRVLHNPQAGKGMQVHVPYTVYAHFFLMRQILSGAGVKKVEYSMDCESLLRGAFLSAWCDEVKQGTAHGFYVRHAKYLTVTEREAAKKEARMRLKVFQDSLPEDQRHEAALLMMMHNFEAATPTANGRTAGFTIRFLP